MEKRYLILCFTILLCSCSAKSTAHDSEADSSVTQFREGDVSDYGEPSQSIKMVDGSGTVFSYPDLGLGKITTRSSTSVLIYSQESSFTAALDAAKSLLADSSFIYAFVSLPDSSKVKTYSYDISFTYENDSYYLNLLWTGYADGDLLAEFGIEGDCRLYSVDCSFVDSSAVGEDVSGLTLFGYTSDSSWFEELNGWISSIDGAFSVSNNQGIL